MQPKNKDCNIVEAHQRVLKDVQLDDAQMSELMAMQLKPQLSPKKHVFTAAVLLIFLVIGGVWTHHWSGSDQSQIIAREVVKNHLKLKPLDVTTDSQKALQAYFSQLDFVLQPLKMSTPLLGGRYCSVRTVPAAQLRYGQGQGIITVYQAVYQPELHGEIPDVSEGKPLVRYANGLTVTLWRQKNILMVQVE